MNEIVVIDKSLLSIMKFSVIVPDSWYLLFRFRELHHVPSLASQLCCVSSSQHSIKALQIQRLLTLPPSPRGVCLPASLLWCQTNHSDILRERYVSTQFLWQWENKQSLLSYYCKIAKSDDSTTAHRRLWKSSSVSRICLEDNCCSPWNIKLVL